MPSEHNQRRASANENLLIDRIARSSAPLPAEAAQLRLGIGDDAAIWRPKPGHEAVLTCDWFLEGTHFLPDWHPSDSIGWKCLARATSDVAAMAGQPRCFLLSLALPEARTGRWLNGFLQGLRRASVVLRCPIAGGDTTSNDQVLIHVTVIGEVRRGHALLRSGARPGDIIFVTGRLGEAEYGLRLIQQRRGRIRTSDSRLRKHLYPNPRLTAAAKLAQLELPTAMMDLSDGLSTDLRRLCAASGVGAQIEVRRLPGPAIARNDRATFSSVELASHGGDDYELLFTVAKKNLDRVPKAVDGLKLTRVGAITANKTIEILGANGQAKPLPNKGWDPFGEHRKRYLLAEGGALRV